MPTWLPAGAQAHPKITRIVAHWQAIAPEPGLLPGRQHFDPIAVPDLLPHISLTDVLRGTPNRYRFRLLGTALVEGGVMMRPGEMLGEGTTAGIGAQVSANFDRILETREPDWHRGKPLISHAKFITELERVFLPLAGDGREVDMLLGLTLFYWQDGHVY